MGKLFAVVVAIIALISAAIFAMHVWWLPPDISVLGEGIDHQLSETMVASGVLFVLAQLALAVFVWRSSGSTGPIKIFPGGATPMVVLAITLVGIEILVLSFVGGLVLHSPYHLGDLCSVALPVFGRGHQERSRK